MCSVRSEWPWILTCGKQSILLYIVMLFWGIFIPSVEVHCISVTKHENHINQEKWLLHFPLLSNVQESVSVCVWRQDIGHRCHGNKPEGIETETSWRRQGNWGGKRGGVRCGYMVGRGEWFERLWNVILMSKSESKHVLNVVISPFGKAWNYNVYIFIASECWNLVRFFCRTFLG